VRYGEFGEEEKALNLVEVVVDIEKKTLQQIGDSARFYTSDPETWVTFGFHLRVSSFFSSINVS